MTYQFQEIARTPTLVSMTLQLAGPGARFRAIQRFRRKLERTHLPGGAWKRAFRSPPISSLPESQKESQQGNMKLIILNWGKKGGQTDNLEGGKAFGENRRSAREPEDRD